MVEWKPLIIAASFAPNPVNVGSHTVLSVIVIDAQGSERDDLFYAGELQSGEVDA